MHIYDGWLVGLSQLSAGVAWAYERCAFLRMEGLFKESLSVFTGASEKIMGNSERLGRQVRPGNEPGTSQLPALRGEPFGHW